MHLRSSMRAGIVPAETIQPFVQLLELLSEPNLGLAQELVLSSDLRKLSLVVGTGGANLVN